ncbi:MAG: DUF3306 domain-containing protein [Bradyrhizobium sp.]|nr:DUF3306 domain-containing protein [Bradyrhizobium sp.]
MSDEEFLKRWSRRKQEAKAAVQAPPAPADETKDAISNPPQAAAEPEIDLSKLPTIDSITAATDITEFLRKGIPAELSRAALRRAWAADPAIRDFVGLAENAWDFTDPNAMPGFGALEGTPEQIGAMLERVIGGARESAEKLASELPETEQVQQESDQEPAVSASTEALPEPTASVQSPPAESEQVAAAQPEASDEDGDVVPVRRRTHGGALPI